MLRASPVFGSHMSLTGVPPEKMLGYPKPGQGRVVLYSLLVQSIDWTVGLCHLESEVKYRKSEVQHRQSHSMVSSHSIIYSHSGRRGNRQSNKHMIV